jgi:hypothetical protein
VANKVVSPECMMRATMKLVCAFMAPSSPGVTSAVAMMCR